MKSVETLTTHAQGQNGNSATPAAAEASGRPLEFIEFFNHTSDIVLTIDSDYRITAANDAARTTLPLHWGKIPKIGSSVLELFPAHEHTRLKALYDSMLRGEPAERQHLEMVSPNGNLQHYEVTYYLLNAQPDSSARIAMFMRNVTDLYEIQRKQREDAEHALHQAKEQFYKTANTVPGMIYQIVFHPDGTVSYPYVSEGCRTIYGIAPEAAMRDASILTKMWHPDDIGEYMRRVEECRRTLKPFDMECRIVLPDGTIKWLRVNSVPEPQPDGSLCFYGIRTDITAQKQTAATLNQQRIQMNAAADLAKLAFWEGDVQKQTLLFNDRYFALLGTTAQQAGGYTISLEKYLEYVLPEDVPTMLQHLQNVLSNPTLMRGETMYRIRRLDNGEIRYLKVIYNVERNAEGVPVRLFGPIQDVTEQEETLLALRQQQLQMNAAADLAKLAFWEGDLQKQTFIFNEQCYALLGTSLAREGRYELSVADYLSRFVLPEDVPQSLQHLQSVLENPALKRGQAMYRIRRADDGSVRYIKVIYNVERNQEGLPIRLFGPMQDVTEQEEASLALRQSEEKFRKTVNTIPSVIYQLKFNPDGSYSYPFVSENCKQLYEVSAEDAMRDATILTKMWHPDDVEEYWRQIRHTLETLTPLDVTVRIITPSGKVKWVRINSNPEKQPDGSIVLYGVRTDITAQKQTEAILNQQRIQMNAAADLAKLAFYESDVQTLFLNDRYFALLGTTAQQEGGYAMSVQKYLEKFVLPEDVPAMLQHMRSVLSNPTLMRGETMYRIRRLDDGQIRYLKAIFNVERNAEGVPVRLFGPIQDVTEQEETLLALRQQQLQMNAAADLAKMAFWEVDMASSSFIFNERCYALIGTTAEQEGGYTISVEKYLGKFVLLEDVPAMLQHLQNVLSNPTLMRGETMYRIRRPDNGEIRYIKVIYNVERNAEGVPVRLFGPIQDVTEQEETLLALRQSEEKFRKTVSSVPGMVYEFTILPDGTMAMPYVSEGCRELFGVEPEVITKDLMAVWSSMMHPDDIAASQVAIAESAANLSPFVYEARFSLPTGKNIWTRFYGRPVKRDDGTVLWYGVCVDITELKALEAELKARLKEIQETQRHLIQTEKMSALGQMVAGIAHELNTPIGYASNNVLIIRDRFRNISSLLRKALEAFDCIYSNQLEQAFAKMQEVALSPNGTIAELDETIRRTDRLFAGISSGFEQMANLVKSMRNFSRLDEAEMKKADINEGLRSCLLMIGHQFKDKNIELITEYGEIPMVDCFPAQLNQVFLNLIANAIHAVEEKPEGKIHVSSTLEDGYVMVRVKDNGKGIPKHIQDKIFDPFFTTKPVGKGTGLGLSICYNIVQKHKGQLYFETTEGVGTTFIVKIPAVDFLEA